MKKIVLIGGPTASGKTDLAISIAKEFNGELINADSRQIYKYLDIGTNKGEIKKVENTNYIDSIPMHLVNFLNPDVRYSVYDFKVQATSIIDLLLKNNKIPIIVGGTGLYIDSLIKNYNLLTEHNIKLRDELERFDVQKLQNILIKENKDKFLDLNPSDQKNKRRLIRLIEKISDKNGNTNINTAKFDSLFIYPNYDWQELKIKIEHRVEQMFKQGLVEEVEKVLELGYPKDSVALQGTGYKEVIKYLNKQVSLQKCIELVKISHKQYARRQRTWFEGEGRGYKLNRVSSNNEAIKFVKKFYLN